MRSVSQNSASDNQHWLLGRGTLYVAVPDVLASDQLIAHVVEVIDNPEASGRLESSHRVELQALEDLGFSSIAATTPPRPTS